MPAQRPRLMRTARFGVIAAEDDPTATRRTVFAPALGVEFEPVDGTESEVGITRENAIGGPAHEIEGSVQYRIGRAVALRLSALR